MRLNPPYRVKMKDMMVPLACEKRADIRATLERDGRIYNAIIPVCQPPDGRLVAFCWTLHPDAEGHFPTFRHDLYLLGKSSSLQITTVADAGKAARLAIGRAALFGHEHRQRD